MQAEVQITAISKSHQITVKANISAINVDITGGRSFSMTQAYGLNINGRTDLYPKAELLTYRVNMNVMCW